MSRRGSQSSQSSDETSLWTSLRPTPDLSGGTPIEPSSFPSMVLPPNKFRINDRATLEAHLKTSNRLFEAYSQEFGTSVPKDSRLLIDDESLHFEILSQWSDFAGTSVAKTFFSSKAYLEVRSELVQKFVAMAFDEEADLVGLMFLKEVFEGWLTARHLSSHPESSVLDNEVEKFYEAVKELSDREAEPPTPRADFATGFDTAFDAEYIDPHNMASFYARVAENVESMVPREGGNHGAIHVHSHVINDGKV
jgi:hypothetical protein